MAIETSLDLGDGLKLQPLHDRVLILPEAAPEKTASGRLIIPESARKKTFRGKLVAYGGGMHTRGGGRYELFSIEGVKIGDTVHYAHEHGATVVKLNGVEHVMVRDDMVLAVVED